MKSSASPCPLDQFSTMVLKKYPYLRTHIINHARKQQRDLIITPLDLKNALGEVSHDLLLSVLKYHHNPDHIIDLDKSLYTNYQLTITTDSYVTSPITVCCGILQEDSLSPPHFNLVINTFINIIKQDKINCLGYVYDGTLAPKYRMLFADYTALVTFQNQTASTYVMHS